MTKNEMARFVIWALWNMPSKPEADDKRVKSCERSDSKAQLKISYDLAYCVLKMNGKV